MDKITHYYIEKDGRIISDYVSKEEAEKANEVIKGDICTFIEEIKK